MNRSLDLVGDIRKSAPPAMKIEFIDCKNLPLTPRRDVDVDRIAGIEAELLVLHEFEHLTRLYRGSSWMRQLRPAVQMLLQGGTSVIVVSAVPQQGYPQVDGSSLATDCYQATFSGPEPDTIQDEAEYARALKYAGGFVGVASALVGRLVTEDKPNQRLARSILAELMPRALLQCGAETFAWVTSTFLYQGQSCVEVDEVNSSVSSTLCGAGLGRIDPASDCLELFPRIPRREAERAIQHAEDSLVEAPEAWRVAAKLVFELERLVRKALAVHLEKHPHAAETALTPYSRKILENFKNDTGIRKASVSDVPNPWKWIDLSDVLTVCQEQARGGRVADLGESVWHRIADDAVPIRNRIQHMRLPQPDDVNSLRTHIGILRQGLGINLRDRGLR